MENANGPTSMRIMPPDSQNDNKENKLHSLKEVPKRGFIQIKESFRTLKNVNRQSVTVKGTATKNNTNLKLRLSSVCHGFFLNIVFRTIL